MTEEAKTGFNVDALAIGHEGWNLAQAFCESSVVCGNLAFRLALFWGLDVFQISNSHLQDVSFFHFRMSGDLD